MMLRGLQFVWRWWRKLKIQYDPIEWGGIGLLGIPGAIAAVIGGYLDATIEEENVGSGIRFAGGIGMLLSALLIFRSIHQRRLMSAPIRIKQEKDAWVLGPLQHDDCCFLRLSEVKPTQTHSQMTLGGQTFFSCPRTASRRRVVRVLFLDPCPIDETFLVELILFFPRLEILNLRSARIEAGCLAIIGDLSHLRHLFLDADTDPAGIRALLSDQTEVEIHADTLPIHISYGT